MLMLIFMYLIILQLFTSILFIDCLHITSSNSKNLYPRIAFTREYGNNQELMNLLHEYKEFCYELPCISFQYGSDIDKLASNIISHDIIAITSPQAANVFIESWKNIGSPKVQIVTVGKGTSNVLKQSGLSVAFEPSEYTAQVLANELPTSLGTTILYPSSSLADTILQNSLTQRNFKVTRLNTYETIPSIWTEEELILAKSIDIVTFASPSAIKIWTERCGNHAIACVIGPTSLQAAKKLGYEKVFSPKESKGIEAWSQVIKETIETFE